MHKTKSYLYVTSVCVSEHAPMVSVNKNVYVSVYSSADVKIYAPDRGTLSYTVSAPLGRIEHYTICCSYSQSLQYSFLVPPGTHHCWVDRGVKI